MISQTNFGNGNNRVLKILLFIVIPVLVIFITAGVFLLTRNNASVQKSPDVSVDQELSPWGYADQVSTKPATPTLAALDSKYKQVQDAVAKRDYDAFKAVASTERIWHVEHPKKLVNESSSGEPVYETLEPAGKENFIRYSPYSILFKAPSSQNVFPIQVIEREPSTRPDIILVDKNTNTKTRVKMTVWEYTVDLIYRTKEGYPDQGTGSVSFVWDNGDWKYNGEYWTLSAHSTPIDVGDVVDNPVSTFNVDKSGKCSPQSLDVSAGSTVSWQGVAGEIYSVSPAPYWDSGFLYSDRFFKRFDTPGTYTYLIQQIPNQPEDSKDCVVNVK